MYAASEFELLNKIADTRAIAPELLLPTWIRTVHDEAKRYALDNLLQVDALSQVGVGLTHGPRVLNLAERQGTSLEIALEEKLSEYARLAGLADDERPRNERWVFLEYAGGDPRYAKRDDDLWPGGEWVTYYRKFHPSALGMGLIKQVMEAKALLSSGEALDRYLALVLTEAMVNKLIVLDEWLTIEWEDGTPYLAHTYQIDFDGEGQPVIDVIDATSTLFDQLALLRGLAEFVDYSDSQTGELFGKGKVFGSEFHELALKLESQVFDVIPILHRDAEGNLWDVHDPAEKCSRTHSSTVNLGLLLVALKRAQATLAPEGAKLARGLIEEQVGRLLKRQTPERLFCDDVVLQSETSSTVQLRSQLAAIRGLLVAYDLLDADHLLEASQQTFDALEELFWNDLIGVYAGWRNGEEKRYCYTPLDMGLAVGALRELALVSESPRAQIIIERLSQFTRAVVDDAALQLSNASPKEGWEIFHGNGLGEITPLLLVDSPLGVAPVLQQQLCLDVSVSPEPCVGLWTKFEPWFQTDIAMYAAYVMQERASWAEDYADSNLAHLVLHSGMGIPLAGEQLASWAGLAGLEEIPGLTPLALEFASGSPRLASPEELSWQPETFDQRIIGSAIGMTLLREVQEAKQLLSENRDGLVGRTSEEGFTGLMLVGSIQSKLAFLDDLAQKSRERMGRAYVPHAVRAVSRDGGLEYEVVDSSSKLFDQLALLWGLSEAYSFVTDSRYEALFGPNQPFEKVSPELITSLAENVFTTLIDLHFDPELNVLVDDSSFGTGGWRRGKEVTTVDLGLAIASLESFVHSMVDRPQLQERALDLIHSEVEFLTQELWHGSGGFSERLFLAEEPEGKRVHGLSMSLAGQLSAIRALLGAYDALGEKEFLTLAQTSFDVFDARFWDEEMGFYLSQLDTATALCYTPLELGLAVDVLGRLASVSEPTRAKRINERLLNFFDRVADGAKLQLPRSWWHHVNEDGTSRITEFFAQVLARRVCLWPVHEIEEDEIAGRGDRVFYMITVENPSETTCYGVVVEDPLPEGLLYLRSDPPAKVDGQVIRWELGTLDPGEVCHLGVVALLDPVFTYRETLKNCATLFYTDHAGDPQPPKQACVETQIAGRT